MKEYTDIELLELLEKYGYEVNSFNDLLEYRNDLQRGNLVFEEENVEIPKEEVVEESCKKEPEVKKVQKLLKENDLSLRLRTNKAERFLESFLIEENGMSRGEFESLNEETKVDSVKAMAVQVLNSIIEKIGGVDTTLADKSKGDIKQLKNLQSIQDSITALETMIERDATSLPEYAEAIRIIIKSILYINQNSAVFKDAYRNKKTLMILKYESLILSLLASVAYLIANIVHIDENGVSIKRTSEEILEFTGIKSLKAFNASVENGTFKIATRDVETLREFYLEHPVDSMGNILEAYEYLPMIVDGIKNIYSQVVGDNSNKITNLLYKVAGVIVLLFSLREMFYTIAKMKTKVSDMVGGIQNFSLLNSGAGGMLNKLSSFMTKFRNDATFNSDLAKREIEDENRKLLNDVRAIEVKPIKDEPVKVPEVTTDEPAKEINTDLFNFDF